jgi:DHA2 family multidrug resistance protein
MANLATDGRALAVLNEAVTRQAAMIAYGNDFKLMLVLTLAAIPLVLLLRAVRTPRGTPAMAIE